MTDESRNPHRRWANEKVKQIITTVIGTDEIVRLCLVAYCCGGHVLLEGNPGFGKTKLVKRLAAAISLEYGRIQFTPDLMPSDITGTMLPNASTGGVGAWEFQPGPLFASLLLADEINRATPKTQSALLEAMAEGQATVLGQTYQLPKPFVVMATQNPLDHAGTYALPEAQADRFMFKLMTPIPNGLVMQQIIDENINESEEQRPVSLLTAQTEDEAIPSRRVLFATFNEKHDRVVARDPRVADAQNPYKVARRVFENRTAILKKIALHPGVMQHLVNIFLASHKRYDELIALDNDQLNRIKLLTKDKDFVVDGLGPRAFINLAKAAQAWALLFGTTNTPMEDLRADAVDLAHVLIPTLRHRVKLSFDWEQRYADLPSRSRGGFPVEGDPLAAFIADIAINTAPRDKKSYGNYAELMRAGLEATLGSEARRR